MYATTQSSKLFIYSSPQAIDWYVYYHVYRFSTDKKFNSSTRVINSGKFVSLPELMVIIT